MSMNEWLLFCIFFCCFLLYLYVIGLTLVIWFFPVWICVVFGLIPLFFPSFSALFPLARPMTSRAKKGRNELLSGEQIE